MAAQEVRNVRWDFNEEVVLITGAARGQGRAHALGFARAGADLVICDIGTRLPTVDYALGTKEQLEEVAEECRALGVRCLTVVCDVGKSVQVRAMVDAAIAEYGQIDVLVNNAGVESVFHISELTEEAWDDLVNTNLRGVFLCSKYVSEHMVKAGKGRIVCIGSTSSLGGLLNQAHYCAAKHGVAGLTKALAIDLAPHGIGVNYVCPGGVDTPMVAGVMESAGGEYAETVPKLTGQWNLFDEAAMIQPEDITGAVMWLASDAARCVTGAGVVVDAGFTAK